MSDLSPHARRLLDVLQAEAAERMDVPKWTYGAMTTVLAESELEAAGLIYIIPAAEGGGVRLTPRGATA